MYDQYRDEDGMDPGLGDLAYDGSEYELDSFGERITSDDEPQDLLTEDAEADEVSADEMEPAKPTSATSAEPHTKVEQGFKETLGDTDEDASSVSDQLEDEQLQQAAEDEYEDPRADGV